MRYLYDYDDPYKVLSHAIIGFSRPADVLRVLTDDAYLLSLITKEVREMDMKGNFVDCIIEDILDKKKRMEYMRSLDKLAEYYYSQLDKERLRKEIRQALADAGIVLVDCR